MLHMPMLRWMSLAIALHAKSLHAPRKVLLSNVNGNLNVHHCTSLFNAFPVNVKGLLPHDHFNATTAFYSQKIFPIISAFMQRIS